MNLATLNAVVPDSDAIRRGLPEFADGIHAQLIKLIARPTADGAESLACNLDGARRAVLRLRERLLVEGDGHGG